MISTKLKNVIRDIPDFPKPGIVFKDITPILKDAKLCSEIIEAFVSRMDTDAIDVIAGIESRGFLFGMPMALQLGVPFAPARKAGKLPCRTEREPYDLEYRNDVLEMHTDAIRAGAHVLVVDDVFATGGTAAAACRLVERLGGKVTGVSVLVELAFLQGRARMSDHDLHAIVTF
mgnify:CR=1 FL=1